MDEVGLFDEQYFFFFEETDWAYRMRRSGWKVYFVPKARIFHIQGKSIGGGAKGRVIYYRSRYIFFKKWLGHSYNLIRVVVFMRLLVNTFLALLGVLCTLGCYAPIRSRLIVYFHLILWHLRGCP